MTLRDHLRAFVSSSMEELAAERHVVKEALAAHQVEAWLFEADAGAQSDSPRTVFLNELGRADLYLGLFGTKLGQYTLAEYDKAIELGKPCLIYTRVAAPEHPREPALEAFIARLEDVDSGHTVRRFRELDELRTFVADDVLEWQVRRLRQAESSSGDPTTRALATLRAKVDQWYVRELLHNATAHLRALPLKVESSPDAVDVPERETVPPSQPHRLGDDDFVRRHLQGAAQSLLILGEAGSGKSILMAKLLAGVLRQSAPGSPTPVMLRLSTWNAQSSLVDWLQMEIGSQYRVGRDAARRWLDDKRLALFLDGLDEAPAEHRQSCVAAINDYVRQHFVPRLVVSCRTSIYRGIGARLAFEDAVTLMPLDPSDVEASMIASGEAPDTARLLRGDPALRELATSPLFLNLIGSVPGEVLAGARQDAEHDGESLRRNVVSLFIDSAFKRRSRGGDPPKAAALHALTWLARRALQNGGGHIELERVQPGWLSGRLDRSIYTVSTRFVEALIVVGAMTVLIAWVSVLFFGPGEVAIDTDTLVFLSAGMLPILATIVILDLLEKRYPFWIVPPIGFGLFVLLGLSLGVNDIVQSLLSIEGLIAMTPGVALLALRLSRRAPAGDELRPRGEIEVDWRRGASIFAVAMCVGLALESALGSTLMRELTMPGTDNRAGGFNDPVEAMLAWGIHGMRSMATLALPLAIVGSIRTAQISETTYPNQGIVNAAKVAAYSTVVGAALAAAVVWFVFGSSATVAISVGLSLGVLVGFLSGGGDALGHWFLRPLLSAECGISVAPFLDWATEAGLLRRVGGRYVFRHALIAECAASGWPEARETGAARRARQRRIQAAAIAITLVVVGPWLYVVGGTILREIL